MQFTRTNIITEGGTGKSLSSGGIVLEGNQGGGGSEYIHPTGWLWGNRYTGRETLDGDLTSNGTIYSQNVSSVNINATNITSVNGDFTNLDVSNNFFAENAQINDATIRDLFVSGSAHFVELIIDKINSTNGTLILSPAHATLSRVETDSETHTIKCYFRASDGDKKISNDFDVDDLVICQSFNAVEGVSHDVNNKFIWKRVLAKGTTTDGSEHWIQFYTTEWLKSVTNESMLNPWFHVSTNSEFEAEDCLVTLGNKTKADRQKAVLISATNPKIGDVNLIYPGDPSVIETTGPSVDEYRDEDEGVTKERYQSSFNLSETIGDNNLIPDTSYPTDRQWLIDNTYAENINFMFGDGLVDIPSSYINEYKGGLDKYAGQSYTRINFNDWMRIHQSDVFDSNGRLKENVTIQFGSAKISGADNGYNTLIHIGRYYLLAKNIESPSGEKFVSVMGLFQKTEDNVDNYTVLFEDILLPQKYQMLGVYTSIEMLDNGMTGVWFLGQWNIILFDYGGRTVDINTLNIRDMSPNIICLGNAGLTLNSFYISVDTVPRVFLHYNPTISPNLIQNGDFSAETALDGWQTNSMGRGYSDLQLIEDNPIFLPEYHSYYIGKRYKEYLTGRPHIDMAFNKDDWSFLNDSFAYASKTKYNYTVNTKPVLADDTYLSQTVNLPKGTYALSFDYISDTEDNTGDRSIKVVVSGAHSSIEKTITPTSNGTHRCNVLIQTGWEYEDGSDSDDTGSIDFLQHKGIDNHGRVSTVKYYPDGVFNEGDINSSNWGINLDKNLLCLSDTGQIEIKFMLAGGSQTELFAISNVYLQDIIQNGRDVDKHGEPSDEYKYTIETVKYLKYPVSCTDSNNNTYFNFYIQKFIVGDNYIIDRPTYHKAFRFFSERMFSTYTTQMKNTYKDGGINSPCFVTLDGVNDFSMAGKQVSVLSPTYNLIQAKSVNGLDGAIASSSSFKVLADRIEASVTRGELESVIRQMADEIELSVFDDMKHTGIDITSGKVVIDADNTEITGDLVLSDVDQGLKIRDMGVDKIVLENNSIGNLADFDFGSDKVYKKTDWIPYQSSITYQETLGSLNATTPLNIEYIYFNSGEDDRTPGGHMANVLTSYDYEWVLKCNGTNVTSASGHLADTGSGWTGVYMTPVNVTSLPSTGTYTFDITVSNLTFERALSANISYEFKYYVRGISAGVERIGLDGAVFSTDANNYNWMGPDFTAFRRDIVQLDISDGGIFRSDLYLSESGNTTRWYFGDISTTMPVRMVSDLTYTPTNSDGYIEFITHAGTSDGARRTLLLKKPFDAPTGKWYKIKNGTGDDTLITAVDSDTHDYIIAPDSHTRTDSYQVGHGSCEVINNGYEWVIYRCW